MAKNKTQPAAPPTGEVTIESLQQENEALKQENFSITEVNDRLSAKIEELTIALDKKKNMGDLVNEMKEKEKLVLPDGMFTVDGKSYKFNTPVFKWKGQRILTVEAINNQELLNVLVAAKLGVIVEA